MTTYILNYRCSPHFNKQFCSPLTGRLSGKLMSLYFGRLCRILSDLKSTQPCTIANMFGEVDGQMENLAAMCYFE